MTVTREDIQLALARVSQSLQEMRRRSDIWDRATDCSAAYQRVPETAIPSSICNAAEAVRTLWRTHMAVAEEPEIRWFQPQSEGCDQPPAFRAAPTTVGLANRDEWVIWIRRDQDLEDTVRVAAHELYHLIEPEWDGTTNRLDRWQCNEDDALEFEDIFLRRFGRVFGIDPPPPQRHSAFLSSLELSPAQKKALDAALEAMEAQRRMSVGATR